MHSTHSYDGKVPLAELKTLLKGQGISFCCMTEHTDEMTPEGAHAFVEECRELSDETFVFVPGFEVPYQRAHVLHIGASEFLGQFADATELTVWRNVTPLVILAHPVRNHFIVDETLLSVIDGVEVWNQQYEGKHAPRSRSLKLLQSLKKRKENLLATGGLDLHRKEHFGTPQIQLETDALTAEAVVTSLKSGSYTIKGNGILLDAQGQFMAGGGLRTKLQSQLAIVTITAGKLVNATLARFGLSLPKGLRQALRAKV